MDSSDDDAKKQGTLDFGRLFGNLVRFPIESVFTIINAGDDTADTAMLWRFWASLGLAPIEHRVRLARLFRC